MRNNSQLPDEAFQALAAYNKQKNVNYSFGSPVTNFKGGFGKVFNLENAPFPSVVKVIDTFSRSDLSPYDIFINAFREFRAGQMLRGLGSPYVVPFIDGFFAPNYETNGRKGDTLESFYSKNRAIFLIFMPKYENAAVFFSRVENRNEANLIKLAYDLSCGLSLLNTTGIVHCDISPNNIFVLPGTFCSFSSRYENLFALGDFGSAAFLGDNTPVQAFFKPDFVPPEQMEAVNESTASLNYTTIYSSENNGDLCSLGKTLDSFIECYNISVCEKFKVIIDRAKEGDKNKRYPSAETMIKDLEPLLMRTDWPISSSDSALCRKYVEERRFSEANAIAEKAGSADIDCMRARLYMFLFLLRNDNAFQGLCELEKNDLRSKCLVRLYVLQETGDAGRAIRALNDLREAAEIGLSAAKFDYGKFLLEGVNTSRGVSIPPAADKTEGCRFILQAALQGSSLAREYVKSHYRLFEKAIKKCTSPSAKAIQLKELREYKFEPVRRISLISNRADSYL